MDRFADGRSRRPFSSVPARVPAKEFVENVVRVLVERPQDIEIAVVEGERSILVEARVPAAEAGRVIGRDGRVINALRTLIAALVARDGKRAVLDVTELGAESRGRPREPTIDISE